ncbi:hypothetical protein B0A55_02504 [Friedmanniomyces simplex]|uniref:PWI domain-containing protein n=1 Tax=Friedmanniomyces simplex TaxID=329884 RepID=A0A4V5NJS8_9PEZI|nr:hypothetical protein B0A55_02504 [Friedmanniomyces simplex]
MAYYGAPPGAYGQPAFPPAGGMGAPPGFAPPGMPAGSPTTMQGQFQPPPNFNWTAPTIRLGVDGPQAQDSGRDDRRGNSGRGSNAEPLGNRNRAGLGAGRDDRGDNRRGGDRDLERERAAVRESMQALQPPTREEVARTIFVGGLGEGVPGEEQIEDILRCAGKLRRWTRARDADDRVCKFGFAEYEDVDSLEAANEIFSGGVEVPVLKKGVAVRGEDGEVKMMKLLVVVDEQSRKYIGEWKGRGREDDDARQFRLDGCKEDLRQCITSITNAGAYAANNASTNGQNGDGDVDMTNGIDDPTIPSMTVPGSIPGLEDELSDIPAEMRATVAAEIRAFRDRSTRRDIERLRREEEMEQAERQRSRPGARASPPPSSVPLGPRGVQAVQGAPAGPKGFRGAQLPSDYVNGVSFVGANGATNGFNREDEDAEESDEELERRRQAKRDADLNRLYQDAERKWQNRERQRTAALAREENREDAEKRELEREKEAIGQRLRGWDDKVEEEVGREEYYFDRSSWLRKRAVYREREGREDERDRVAEEQERRREAEAKGLADDFLDKTAAELQQKTSSTGAAAQGFKINLGSAAARQRAAAPTTANAAAKRGMADIENLLEDEEDAATAPNGLPHSRPLALKPLTDGASTTIYSGQDLSDAERAAARQALAAEIPTDTASLFATPLNYTYLTDRILEEEIRPFVAKKVVEYLGVQEDLLVETVVKGLKGRRGAGELVGELEGALEEESEVLVRRVWRLGVFWGEAGARGLN